jgi:hypothetical protein
LTFLVLETELMTTKKAIGPVVGDNHDARRANCERQNHQSGASTTFRAKATTTTRIDEAITGKGFVPDLSGATVLAAFG